jgi:hypothetical protein
MPELLAGRPTSFVDFVAGGPQKISLNPLECMYDVTISMVPPSNQTRIRRTSTIRSCFLNARPAYDDLESSNSEEPRSEIVS